jgi:uncharacterized protein YndB with AHSA1/START domain
MEGETVSARMTIAAPAEAIYAVLADPATHPSIDGTGWVCGPLDQAPLSASGQIFRMAMYHPNHPDGSYDMANRVEAFDPPRAISWKPGYDPGDGNLQYGGWIWRYDLVALGASETEVTLTYDWSAVPDQVREHGPQFPPFPPDHLHNSLDHLAALLVS